MASVNATPSASEDTFRCLRVPNFRLFFVNNALSQTGTWTQMVAQGWLVFSLTGSGLWTGAVVAVQRLPSLVIGPWTGVIVDRVDERRIILITQALFCTIGLCLGVLTISGTVQIWMVMALAALNGAVTIVDWPARMSFVSRIVADDAVPNATAMYVGASHTARIVGPATAGVLIAGIGTGWAFLVNAALTGLGILMLLAIRNEDLRPRADGGHEDAAIRAGLRLAFRTPMLRRMLVATAVMCAFGMNWQVTFPLLSELVFESGADGFAVLTGAMGAGAIIGAVLTARAGGAMGRRMTAAGAAFGALTVLAAVAPTLLVAAGILFVAGACSVAFMATAHATVQTAAPAPYRGRVLALYASVIMLANMIGAPLLGGLCEAVGARAGAAIGGLLTVVGVLITVPRGLTSSDHGSSMRAAAAPGEGFADPAVA